MVSKEQLDNFRELFAGYLAGKLTAAQYETLMKMIADKDYEEQLQRLVSAMDSNHIAALETVQMDKTDKVDLWRAILLQIENKQQTKMPVDLKLARSTNLRKVIGYAAILVIIVGGIWLMVEHSDSVVHQTARLRHDPKDEQVLYADVGKQVEYTQNFVRLPDGSKVRLNEGASIKIDTSTFDKIGPRVVRLTGEGYFNVVHNIKRPFVVLTGDLETIDVGTSFNIKNKDGRVQVTVIEGEVRLKNKQKDLKHLVANQQLTLNMSTQQVEVASLENAEAVIAWTGSSLSFENISLDSAMRIIERRFDKHILVAPAIGATKVKASFTNRDSLEDILDVLTSITGTNMEKITKDEIRINKKESL